MEEVSGEVKIKEENGTEYYYPTELALAGVKPDTTERKIAFTINIANLSILQMWPAMFTLCLK